MILYPLLYITALEGYSEITISMNMDAKESSAKTARC
jgi:hypothetical protein